MLGVIVDGKKNRNARALSKLGASKGGKARASVLTPEQRSEIARKAVKTRWAKEKGIPLEEDGGQVLNPLRQGQSESGLGVLPIEPSERVSLFHGEVLFGDIRVPCHVLNDGSRVIAQREVIKALTKQEKPSGTISRIIGTSSLAPYIDADKITSKVIQFRLSGSGHQMLAFGYEATLLIEICEAFLKARDGGVLSEAQLRVAHHAEVILRSCAKVGIIALIDEATGYQAVREEQALQLKLQAFIAEEMQEWARLFPEEFWVQLARLESVHYSPRNRPIRWGKYVMAFVYDAVDKDVGEELRKKNPNPHFKQNLHQWLKEYGREKVRDHLHEVLGVMKTCHDMGDFRRKFGYVFKKSPLQLTFFDLVDTLSYRS
jgi:hypothetical protein